MTYNASTMCGEPANSTGEPCQGPGNGLCLARLQLGSAGPQLAYKEFQPSSSRQGPHTEALLPGRHRASAYFLPVPAGYVDPGSLHRATLTSLQPSTRYYYVYGDPSFGPLSIEHTFLTAPPVGINSTIHFLAIADLGHTEIVGEAGHIASQWLHWAPVSQLFWVLCHRRMGLLTATGAIPVCQCVTWRPDFRSKHVALPSSACSGAQLWGIWHFVIMPAPAVEADKLWPAVIATSAQGWKCVVFSTMHLSLPPSCQPA